MSLIIAALLVFCPLVFSKAQAPLPELVIQTTGMKNGMPLKLTVGVERKGKMFKANYEIVNTTQTPTEAVYIDPRAVTQMKITKNSKNETIYDGTLQKEYHHIPHIFFIYPTSFNRQVSDEIEVFKNMLGDVEYTVQVQYFHSLSGDSYGADVIRSDNHQALTVELYVYIDYSIYVKWLEFKNGDASKALSSLKNYYSHVLRGVNVNYERINRADFSISTYVKTFYVETFTSLFAPFVNDTSKPIEMGPLYAIYTILYLYESNVEGHDAGIFIANLDMEGVNGAAKLESVCSEKAAGIIIHQNQLELTNTITHEIAHMLGSEHDDWTHECSGDHQNIMTSFQDTLDEINMSNSFDFSPCSMSYIQLFLQRLNSLNQNCLLNAPSGEQDLQKDDQLLGERYTPDQQCKLLYGPESYQCSNEKNKDKLCFQMSCFMPIEKECGKERLTTADGTRCGDKMWCVDGVCVQNEKASALVSA